MALIDRLKERYVNDLSDGELAAVIAEATNAVESLTGSATASLVTANIYGGYAYLRLPRPAAAFTSVTEYAGGPFGETATALVANDYRLEFGGWSLRRLQGGDNPRAVWGERVEAVYTPVADGGEREEAILKLAILDLQYRGLGSERAGDYTAESADYAAERTAILRALVRPTLV